MNYHFDVNTNRLRCELKRIGANAMFCKELISGIQHAFFIGQLATVWNIKPQGRPLRSFALAFQTKHFLRIIQVFAVNFHSRDLELEIASCPGTKVRTTNWLLSFARVDRC